MSSAEFAALHVVCLGGFGGGGFGLGCFTVVGLGCLAGIFTFKESIIRHFEEDTIKIINERTGCNAREKKEV